MNSTTRWLMNWRELRGCAEAKRLRDAAVAWATADAAIAWAGPLHVVVRDYDNVKFAALDEELLNAALAYAEAAWRASHPHENIAYGLRLLLQLAEEHITLRGFPPARGKARTQQDFSLAAAKKWIESLPKGPPAWRKMVK